MRRQCIRQLELIQICSTVVHGPLRVADLKLEIVWMNGADHTNIAIKNILFVVIYPLQHAVTDTEDVRTADQLCFACIRRVHARLQNLIEVARTRSPSLHRDQYRRIPALPPKIRKAFRNNTRNLERDVICFIHFQKDAVNTILDCRRGLPARSTPGVDIVGTRDNPTLSGLPEDLR